MKSGTEYARKIKRLFTRLKKKYGMPAPAEPTDPVDQLLFGILHRGTTVARAEKTVGRMRSAMIDLNELRVSTPGELVELFGSGFPYATEKAKSVIKALNDVFKHYNRLDLEDLRSKGKREARRFLEKLGGVDPTTAAGVMLFALDGHAVPADEIMMTVLREDRLVHPEADVEEVQAFLERNITASKAQGYTVLLRRYSEERIKSIAPPKAPKRGGGKAPSRKKKAARKKGPARTSAGAKKNKGRSKPGSSKTGGAAKRSASRAGKGRAV